jgi:hypothetical protein
MRHHSARTGCAILAAVIACWLMVACSQNSSKTGPADATTSSAPDSAGSVSDSNPPTEGSGAESPQPSQNGGPSISVASLPIGGGVEAAGNLQCVDVHLTGVSQLPDQVTISVTGATLAPDGLLTFIDNDCGHPEKRCADGYAWTSQNVSEGCLVSVAPTQPSAQGDSVDVALRLSATISCPNDTVCDSVRPSFTDSSGGPGSLGGSQVSFSAVAPSDSAAASGSPSESST